MIFRK